MDEIGTHWSPDANDIVVAAYLDAFAQHREGLSFNKQALYRQIGAQIERVPGYVEQKFQNISHVMELLGYPWLPGLRPRPNIQSSLLPAVERALATGQSTFLLAPPKKAAGIAESTPLFLGQAPSPLKQETIEPLRRLIRKFDPAARDARNKALGDAGEEFAWKQEIAMLRACGREDLSGKVRWVSKEDGDGAGYDIASFNPDGSERFLEVKTTIGTARTPFFLSENERSFAEENPKRFRLFRLHSFYTEPGAFELVPPLTDHVTLAPTAYRANLL